jgi:uncharacterized protein YbjT (DUF2867 family)
MKRLAAVVAMLALVGGSYAVACDKAEAVVQAAGTAIEGKEVELTGYLTDSNCGAKNAHAEGKACALKCLKGGAKVQLLVEKTLYTLDKVESAETKLGEKVTVTGLLDETTNVIRVDSIKIVKKA